jgi:hypothetical protein
MGQCQAGFLCSILNLGVLQISGLNIIRGSKDVLRADLRFWSPYSWYNQPLHDRHLLILVAKYRLRVMWLGVSKGI